MKKGLVFATVLMLLGVNVYAAGDLVVGGKASITGDATINGNVGIGTANAPVTRLDIVDYQFVKFGQVGVFLKNNAYISASFAALDGETGSTVYTVYGEAKNINGVISTRAHAVGGSGTDSGWVAGLSATCRAKQGIYWYDYTVTSSSKGVVIKNSSNNTTMAEVNW